MRGFVAVVVACGFVAGCGDDGGSPTDPGPLVVAVTVAPDSLVLPAIPATFTLTVIARFTDGSERDVSASPATAYDSPSTAVAGIAGGVVSAAGAGAVWVVAEVGGIRDSVHVLVDEASATAVDSVSTSPTTLAVAIGEGVRLAGTVVWENGARLAATGLPFRYRTDDAAVATTSANGIVRGVAPGNAAVTVSFGEIARRVPVVVELPAPSVSFSRSVLPAIQGACTFSGCHSGAGTPQRGLRLNSYVNLRAGSVNGPVVTPGFGATSPIVLALRGTLSGAQRMPLGRTPLAESTIQAIEAWISEGAFDN